MQAIYNRIIAIFMAIIAFLSGIFGVGNTNPPTEENSTVPTTEQTSTPDVTEPVVTDPPVTEPPVTEPPATEPPVTEPEIGSPEWIEKRAEELMSSMSQKDKIGQLFIVTADVYKEAMANTASQLNPGGVILFAADIETPEQITNYTASMQQQSKIPLFICVDEEGGRVARIGKNSNFNVPTYESMEAVGKTGDPQNAFDAGKNIGAYVKKYGFNVDFAPVADVNTNPNNIVIGNRAFGSDPTAVAGMVSAAIDGFHQSNMITCMKHFPGHGDTTGDTHTGYVSVSKTWDELKNCELIPFIGSMDKTDMIMAAHVTLPNISADGLPASLSKEILTDKLRTELGYDGIIITDSLGMGAISQNYTPAESALKAFEAGVDILLMPGNYTAAFNSIRGALDSGRISEERLNESVMRILKLKIQYEIIRSA